VAIGMDNVEKADNVGIIHLLEQRDLANSCAGNTFVFGFEANFLESDDPMIRCSKVSGLIDNSIST
jgi:hypothetical protein